MSSLHSLEIETQTVDCITFAIIIPKPLFTPTAFLYQLRSFWKKKKKEKKQNLGLCLPLLTSQSSTVSKTDLFAFFFFKTHK